MATALQKANQFVEDKNHGVHNFSTHALKVLLSNTAPNLSTMKVRADVSELAAGSGYTSGGNAATLVSSAQTAGVYKLTVNDVTFTAAGGSIGPFRYAWVYNDTPTSPADPLIGVYDYGVALTITDGNSFLVDLDQVNGLFTDT
jgi:hypothetical protein